MSDAQTQFQTFHSTILLDVENNDQLREKREIPNTNIGKH